MEGPLVTVVTPSYNQGPFIRATIESVLSQDYPRLEYIIMDGGSTDETAAIVREYGNRIDFTSERDRGQSHAINKGFRKAKGSVVAWVNSDDILLPGAVGTAVRALAANPDAGLVYGEGYIIDRDGNVACPFPHTQQPDLWRLVHLSDYILQQSVFFRRDVLEEVGYIDESLHYGLDWDLLIRIGLKHRLAHVPECLGCIREYPETKSSSGGAERVRELHAMLQKHTGMALPPGSIVYGLDSYVGIVCEELERRTPRVVKPLGSLLQKTVRFVAGNIVSRTLLHAQGLYADGWAGKTLLYMLRRGCRTVQIEGFIPEEAGWLRRQELKVECNGRLLGKHAVGTGEFKIGIEIPADLAEETLHLRIVARRAVISTPLFWKADLRRVSYKLSSIRGD